MKKYIIRDTADNFGEITIQTPFEDGKQVNLWLKDHIRELYEMYDYLEEQENFNGDVYFLGDILNLLENIEFEEE